MGAVVLQNVAVSSRLYICLCVSKHVYTYVPVYMQKGKKSGQLRVGIKVQSSCLHSGAFVTHCLLLVS